VEIAKKYGAEGLPTVVFLNARGEWVKDLTLVGYEPPRELAKRLRALRDAN
jgi:thioredoxin-related protein